MLLVVWQVEHELRRLQMVCLRGFFAKRVHAAEDLTLGVVHLLSGLVVTVLLTEAVGPL
jgi:hypothetical protein